MKLKEIDTFISNKHQVNKARILFEGLLYGQVIKINDNRLVLAETTDKSPFKACLVFEDNTIVGNDLDIAELFKISQELTDEELFMISSGTALRK